MRTYFIQAVGGGPIKIGVSVDPESRLRGIQTGCPYRLQLLATLPGNKEAELHSLFSGLRMNGEWFKDDEKIKKWIQRNTLISDRTKISRKKSENPWAGVKSVKRDFVERFCDVIFEPDEISDYLFSKDITEEFDDCRLIEKYDKAVTQKNDYRAGVLSDAMLDCDMEYCNCDGEWPIWDRAVRDLTCCDIIERVGVNKELRAILLACKPMFTRKREEQVFNILPNIAFAFNIVEWGLFGWIEGPFIEPHSVSFFWLNFYSDQTLSVAASA